MQFRAIALTSALISGAVPALADEVNIYTTRQPELIQPVIDAFTRDTGVQVNLGFVEDGIIERLVAEGSRSPADLVMTVDIANLQQIVDAGVIQPVDSAVLVAAIPPQFRDPDNLWFGLTTRARIVYASKERVAEGEVTTYEDLASDKWRDRICTRSGTHDYNLGLMSALIAHDGEAAAKDWATGVKTNLARKPQGNDRAQVKAIWAGECDISLGNTYYMGQMLADPEQIPWADSVRIIFPTFVDGGTHLNVSGIALTKAAPHKDNAIKLIEFLVSTEAQSIYAEINNEYPVLAGARVSDLVASWGDFTPDTIDLTQVAKQRPTALRIMEEVDFDG